MKNIFMIGVLAGIFALTFVYLGSGKDAKIPPLASQWIVNDTVIERGRQVAIEGDCVACHTAPNGAPFAGGVHFASPFGDIYSTNITPDLTHGIGGYTREDFYRAVKYGYSKNVGNLYPAMPYTSYRKLNDEDMNALWAYFQSVTPIAEPNISNDLIFPANIRFGLGGWNQLFFDDSNFSADPHKSEQWNQGKYFVEAAGHCGECHTPRNFAFAMKPDQALEGALLEGWNAMNITSGELKNQGWTAQELNQFLKQGESKLGITFDSMFMVVNHSLSHMTQDDFNAISAYLLDLDNVNTPVMADQTATTTAANKQRHYLTDSEKSLAGYKTYVNYCAGCHGVDGLGKPNAVVALDLNSTFSANSPYNSIAVILRGLPSKRQSVTKGSVAMSSFNNQVSDKQVAELVNFARAAWGNQPESTVDAKMVTDIRQTLENEGYLGHMQQQASH
ncbi:cytochrome c [Shewanella surugensis]|uniref:C-type cytochrome n=1 Tax=Shewanella surugensis TaxID=212020 RepID=A0ABT0L6I6_9GAMM|nr:cytochrome c [Shewanella surugensis]MCL1123275.1 c-type cytochrome [Shewanella surugensis]